MDIIKNTLHFQLQHCSLLESLLLNWYIKQLQLHSTSHTLLER